MPHHASHHGPHHVVVDGSNIATEGRSMPSLAQLNDAVLAFMAEHPDALITVVVDATFGHRIDSKEVKEFDEAIANNELVAPPAGAVGRGDAFVLSIANKVNATILTNDSFQEFHGQYSWLFDEGRLIGGKPVPHIGWVFVPRIPVRGPVSRSAMKEAKRKKAGADRGTARIGSPEASQPMPVPKAPPPGARVKGQKPAAAPAPAPAAAVAPAAAAPKAGHPVNDLLPFLSFVEHHPVGSSVNAVVESYSSHGAYVRVGEVKGYVPLRLMADPAPRSAREFMKIGDAITLVVDSFAAARRSIDLAVVGMSTAKPPAEKPAKAAKADKPVKASKGEKATKASKPAKASKAPKADEAVAIEPVEQPVVAEAPARGGRRGKKAAAPAPVEAVAPTAAEETPTAPAPAKKRGARKAAPAAEPAAETLFPAAEPAAVAPAKKRAAKKAAASAGEPEPAAAPATKRAARKAAAEPAPVAKKAAKKAAAPAKKR